MSKFDELVELVEGAKVDAEKAYGGNKAAGARLRKVSLAVQGLCRAVRVETLELAKGE